MRRDVREGLLLRTIRTIHNLFHFFSVRKGGILCGGNKLFGGESESNCSFKLSIQIVIIIVPCFILFGLGTKLQYCGQLVICEWISTISQPGFSAYFFIIFILLFLGDHCKGRGFPPLHRLSVCK